MKKKSYYSHLLLDDAVQEKILNIMMFGNNRAQSAGYFRVTLGLYYLSKIMVEEELDFKMIDCEFNRFIYRTLGGGHSITSILQYMSSKQVLLVLKSESFIATFLNYFSEIPFRNIPILLSINLSVSKKSPAWLPQVRCRTGFCVRNASRSKPMKRNCHPPKN